MSIKCTSPLTAKDLLTNITDQSIKRARKILPLDIEWDTYKIISDYEVINMLNTDIVNLRTSPSQEIIDKCINQLSSGLYNAATTSKQRIVNTDISEEVILPFINLLHVAMKRFLSGQTESDEWNAIYRTAGK